MHLNDYSVGDEVELTRDVCDSKMGTHGVVYQKSGTSKAVRLNDGVSIVTSHVRLLCNPETMSPEQLRRWASINNHPSMFRVCDMYYRDDKSWEQCLQILAVYQAKQIKELEKILMEKFAAAPQSSVFIKET